MAKGTGRMYGWKLTHKVGDLIRVTNRKIIQMEPYIGTLGVITQVPWEEQNGGLFVAVYLFKDKPVHYFSAQEIEIISNIDD